MDFTIQEMIVHFVVVVVVFCVFVSWVFFNTEPKSEIAERTNTDRVHYELV